jgi:hypothetical protein
VAFAVDYAIYCTPDPNTIPADVLDRREPVRFRDLWMERTMPLGEWAREYIANHNRAVEYLAELRNTKDSIVEAPQAHRD